MLCYLISLSLLVAGSHGLRRFVDPVVVASSFDHADIPAQPQYTWTENWYPNMPIDHFSYGDSRTFSLRYLMNLDKYVAGGPIFFYTGNEGPIDGFANNTGFMWDLSIKFKAAVVFAEHRFYGKTQPFGDQSYTDIKNLAFLSSEQALADYAVLLGYLKKGVGAGSIPLATNAPVIAFGGSYGGMLAAWFRINALASSAPVLQFVSTGIDQGVFARIIKRTYVNSGCKAENFLNAWTAIRSLASNADGRSFLNTLFKLSPESQVTNVNDGDGLIYFIREAIECMAMVDYPYPSNFLKPLPGWPVQVACSFLNEIINDERVLATAMYNVANFYYNFMGSETTFCAPFISSSCPDAAYSALSSPLGWPWQACTEMTMPMCSLGPPNDLFTPECPSSWTQTVFFSECAVFSNLGFTQALVLPDWIITNYGGNFAAASNIIFSNGDLDPWSGGGVSSSSPGIAQAAANGVYTMLIPQSGHHLDLRQPNSCDPPSVKQAHFQQVAIMWCWAYPNDAQCVRAAITTESRFLLPLFFAVFLIGEFFDYNDYKFILTAIAKWLLIAPFNVLLILDFFLLATTDQQSLQNRDGCLFDPMTNRTRVNTDVVGVNETFILRNAELFIVHFRCDYVEAVLGRQLYYVLGGFSIIMFLFESWYAFFDWSNVVKWTKQTGFIALTLFLTIALLYLLACHIAFLN